MRSDPDAESVRVTQFGRLAPPSRRFQDPRCCFVGADTISEMGQGSRLLNAFCVGRESSLSLPKPRSTPSRTSVLVLPRRDGRELFES